MHPPPLSIGIVVALILTVGFAFATQSQAAARRLVGGWVPYWSTASSLASFKANADLFADVSPFWHSLTSDTVVIDQDVAADQGAVLAAARSAGVPVVPAITDGMGRGQLSAALADPARRSVVVSTLVSLALDRGYAGIDLDLEGFASADGRDTWAATRPNWVAFVADLGSQLHSRGKVLYATVPPTYDSNRSSTSGFWVYDYAGIAPHIDRLRIMAYDYSVASPGPIAPYAWVERIVAYAVTQVPSAKVVLGLPTYGRNWVKSISGTCPTGVKPSRTSLTASAAWDLAASKAVAVQWDGTAKEQVFTYEETFSDGTTSCTVSRVVYFSDASAVIEKARFVDTYLLGGVAFWSIGGEDARQWELLRTMAADPWDPRVAPYEQVRAFVREGYRDILGRQPDPAGWDSWTNALRRGALSRAQMYTAFVYSTEASWRTATAMYRDILQREPDPQGLLGWGSAISARRVTVKTARAAFWASSEKSSTFATPEAWVTGLYRSELGRDPDPAGLSWWPTVYRALGPMAAAQGVIGSTEWAQRQTKLHYQSMLHRDVDPIGAVCWPPVVVNGDLPDLQIGIGSSSEYFILASS